jgi:hypothetical protein
MYQLLKSAIDRLLEYWAMDIDLGGIHADSFAERCNCVNGIRHRRGGIGITAGGGQRRRSDV